MVAWTTQADIGAVDAHAEGDGGGDDVEPLAQEAVLHAGAVGGAHARVVGRRGEAGAGEHVGDGLGVLAAEAVDDDGLAPVSAHDLEYLGVPVGAGHDAVDEVGPVEGADEHVGLTQAELLDDVAPDALGGGGGEGVDRGVGEAFAEDGEAAVLGRKSWPHWLMQWASSMARRAMPREPSGLGTRSSQSRNPSLSRRSGETRSRRASARASISRVSASSAGVHAEWSAAAW
jgi:hypothetical protein